MLHTVRTTSPEEAATFIHQGEVVAFPTETVYGLGADVFNAAAIQRIFEAKGRPADNPLIVHLATLDQIADVAETVTPAAAALIQHFFPGPLTVILPKCPDVSDRATGGLNTVGVRMPDHPLAQAFLEACGCPVAAPSANRSGRPSPTSWEAVHADLNGRIACILQGDRTPAGLESTVVDCKQSVPLLLRAGVISLETLQSVWPDIEVAAPNDPRAHRSPGTRYRHYAPRARVQLVASPDEATPHPEAAYIGRDVPSSGGFGKILRCETVDRYAHELFAFFRDCDAAHLRIIYCQTVSATGLGRALMDRLQRAAASHT